MALFWRGASIGSYWHTRNACHIGFTPHFPGMIPTINQLMQHIARGTVASPYVSLSRSYAVAWSYAVGMSGGLATPSNPAYVYQLEINSKPSGFDLVDPVIEIAPSLPPPWTSISYYHDGWPKFLLGVVDPKDMTRHLKNIPLQAPGGKGNRPANLTIELETIVRALRDSEVLVVGHISENYVTNRYAVW